ncbi:MAG: hypothetical protein OXL95_09610 [Nitrospira sp.]|nr:hypothetical protein [Nitrospira sp.]MDE0485880.1 hypothetical protein [Nitrospira sp.]
MAIYLEAICAKIGRADRELHALRTDMENFCERQRVEQKRITRKNPDGKSADIVEAFLADSEKTPIEWSVRIGEIVYNLRSSLDHLVWQLVVDNGKNPSRKNAFPIFSEESDWENMTKDKLSGVRYEIKKRIRDLQPFGGGLGLPFNVNVFGQLDYLCNVDKHRHLNLVCTTLRGLKPEAHSGEALDAFEEKRPISRDAFQVGIKFSREKSSPVAGFVVSDILEECVDAVRGAVDHIVGRHLYRNLARRQSRRFWRGSSVGSD